jgi:hypothetical protein
MVAQALWGEDANTDNLATISVKVAAEFYEEILDARDEEIRYLQGRVAELNRAMGRIRREASV